MTQPAVPPTQGRAYGHDRIAKRLACLTSCGLSSVRFALLAWAGFCVPVDVHASDWISHTPGDFGGIGLLQDPTARMDPDGEFRIGISHQYPYNNLYASLQLLPWLETAIRYTETRNRAYGAEEFSGDQTNKDRGVDFKLRLLQEGDYLPEVALGFRDVGGTGLFSSEYLVASRRWGAFDLTLGMAWGRMGARGGITNPFAALSDSFEDRPGEGTVDDATLGAQRWFAGEEVGLFGGVEWQTPLDPLTVKLEYDGNDYQSEALSNDQDVDSPLNIGINYRLARMVDLSLGLERGNTASLAVSFRANWQNGFGPQKLLDPPTSAAYAVEQPIAFTAARSASTLSPAVLDALRAELDRQKIELLAVDADDASGRVTVWYRQSLVRSQALAVSRLAQTLALMLPERYQDLVMVVQQGDAELARVEVRRADVARVLDFRLEPEDLGTRVSLVPVQDLDLAQQAADWHEQGRYPEPAFSIGPGLRQHVGGPDDFYFGQLWLRMGASLALTRNWSTDVVVGANIYNNFDGLTHRETSALPNVRSDIVQYIKEGENNLVRLETNYIWSPAPNWYARLSAGIFEQMFGGVATEVLYRQSYAPWAVGVNVNRVRQRDYDQRFDFQDYEVTTGHLTGYFRLPWYELQGALSVGRYLAGDVGATLELSREFANGVRAGVFATKTDVSSEEFGEGSFDKGFVLSLPLDLFFARSSPQRTNFVFRPLTRDGGQKVRDGKSLYSDIDGGSFEPAASWYGTSP